MKTDHISLTLNDEERKAVRSAIHIAWIENGERFKESELDILRKIYRALRPIQ